MMELLVRREMAGDERSSHCGVRMQVVASSKQCCLYLLLMEVGLFPNWLDLSSDMTNQRWWLMQCFTEQKLDGDNPLLQSTTSERAVSRHMTYQLSCSHFCLHCLLIQHLFQFRVYFPQSIDQEVEYCSVLPTMGLPLHLATHPTSSHL